MLGLILWASLINALLLIITLLLFSYGKGEESLLVSQTMASAIPTTSWSNHSTRSKNNIMTRDENGFGIFGISETVFVFSDRNRQYRYFSESESVIGILDQNQYQNRYSPLPIVFFGYRFGSKCTEFKIRNLPKLMAQPKF
jgi:hypothetical protein